MLRHQDDAGVSDEEQIWLDVCFCFLLFAVPLVFVVLWLKQAFCPDGEKDGEIGGSRGDMGRHPRPARTTTPPTGPSRWTSSSSTTPRSSPAPASGAALTTAPHPRVPVSAAVPARPAGAAPGCTWNAAVCIPTPEGPPTLSAPAPLILPLPQPPLRPQWAAMPLQRRRPTVRRSGRLRLRSFEAEF